MSQKRIKYTSGPVEVSSNVPEEDVEDLLNRARDAWAGKGPVSQTIVDETSTLLINLSRVDTVHVQDTKPF